MTDKDLRWAKQFGDFAENLTMYVLGQLSDMSVALIDHVGADVIASKRIKDSQKDRTVPKDNTPKRYAISVKGRNIPPTESKSFNFSQGNIDKLTETAATFGMIPAVSFVFVDEMEGPKKIRMFVANLTDLQEMSDDPQVGFLNKANDGFSLRYTESDHTHWLKAIRECNKIAYFEMQFNVLENVLEKTAVFRD